MVLPSRGICSRNRRSRLRGSVFLAVAGTLVVLGLAKLSGPLATLREQDERLSQLRSERDALTAERDRLQRRTRLLATEAGQEGAARRRGYLRPGERRLMFVRGDSLDSSSVEPPASVSE